MIGLGFSLCVCVWGGGGGGQVSKTLGKILVVYHLIFINFLGENGKAKDCGPNGNKHTLNLICLQFLWLQS